MLDLNNAFIQYPFPDHLDVDQFKGKKIIVVGSGPTVNSRHWERLDYDFIFSCNLFYKNEKLNSLRVDLVAMINCHLIPPNQDFINKIEKDQSLVASEKKHQPHNLNHPNYVKFRQDYFDRFFFFDTQFQNKAGIASRLAILALSLQPSHLMLIGVDGLGLLDKTKNSFDLELESNRDGYNPQEINNNHLEFANYLYNSCSQQGVILYNLGEGDENNVYTSTSSKHYPLPKDIKSLITRCSTT